MRTLLSLTTLFFCSLVVGFGQQKGPAEAKPRSAGARSLDFDRRTGAIRTEASSQVLQSLPGGRVRISQANGRPTLISAGGAPLSAPANGPREQLVRNFLQRESRLFAFLPKDPDQLRLVRSDESNELSVLFFQQYIGGIPVFDGSLKASLDRDGALIQVDAGALLPSVSVGSKPGLTGREAIQAAYRASAGDAPGAVSEEAVVRNGYGVYQVEGGPEVPTELVVFPVDANAGRLAYRVFLRIDASHYFEIVVDATDGSLLLRRNLVRRAGQARVWKESPLIGPRELVTFPDGWLPDASQVTTGNNTDVFLDRNGDGRPDTTAATGVQGGRAFAPSQVFDFLAPEGDGLNPGAAAYRAASVTNLFYLVNVAHDYFYTLGFTEAAGNFQTSNFGRGGISSDAVVGLAQSGSDVDNASFVTLPDGLPGVLSVGVFINGTLFNSLDDRDGAYDGTVVLHEYSHGVNSRLVGGPSNVACLNGIQSGAMDEGWADYFAGSFYNKTIIGAYVTQNPGGFRRQNYAAYTFTYEDIGNQDYETHNDGEIWAATLLDIRKSLGATVTDALVVSGLKLTPCNPTMILARDAILAADRATNNGVNQEALWRVFARHGLGFSALGTDGDRNFSYPRMIYYVAAFDLPPGQQTGNRPPVVSSSAPPVARAGTIFTYKIDAADSDGGTVRYELAAGPSGFTISPTTGLLQGLPDFTSKRVKVVVTDGQGGRAVVGFLLNVETPLTIGQPLSVSGALDSSGVATVDVPANTSILQVKLRGGTGDADLYLTDPSGGTDLFGDRTGTSETISISNPKAGRWTIEVFGYEAYGGKTLVVDIPVPGVLANAVPTTIDGEASSETYWKIVVPMGATRLEVRTTRGTGDVDLFLKRAVPPACQTFEDSFSGSYCIKDFYSAVTGNEESIVVENPQPGDWYIDVSAVVDYTGVILTATVSSPPGISLNVSEMAFTARQGTVAPASQNLVITNFDLVGPPFAWTAATVITSGDWLRLSATSGNQGATVAVSVVPNGLAVGTYQAKILITAAGIPNSPQTVNVTFTITAAPNPVVLDVEAINGASFLSGVAPGSWFTIRGTNLSQTTRIWTGADFIGTALPTILDGVSVKVNGKDAYIYFISGSQINALAPDDVTTGPVQVTVTNRQGSATTTAKLAKFAPAFFMFDPQNRRYAAAVHLDGVLAGPAALFGAAVTTRPLAAGNRVLLYGTGFGPTTSTTSSGQILASAAPILTSSNLSITIGGVPAVVEFAGLVNNGLYQFNVIVPSIGNGDHALVATVGGVSTPTGVFVSVLTPGQ